MKSVLTRGKSQTDKIPLYSPLAAFLIISINSSRLNDFSVSKVKSNIETFNVGTLVAIPLSFPSSSGITKPIAFAAPVLDGMIDADAALALYKSTWATSNKL